MSASVSAYCSKNSGCSWRKVATASGVMASRISRRARLQRVYQSHVHLAFEHRHGGTRHHHRLALPGPRDGELAAARLDLDAGGVEHIAHDTGDDRGARAGAARERLA